MNFTRAPELVSSGLLKIGVVTSDPTADSESGIFRCEIADSMSFGKYFAVANPSPYGSAFPEMGSMVTYLDYPGTKRIISVIHDVDNGNENRPEGTPEESPSNIAAMSPGDVFLGKHGRIYFNGDVNITSENIRSSISLDDDEGLVTVTGYNLDLHTEDESIRIFTSRSNPLGFGDSLTIKKCLTGTGVTFSTISLDYDGSFSVKCGISPVADPAAQLSINSIGDMSLENPAANIAISALGDISSYGINHNLESSAAFDIKSASLNIDATSISIKGSSIGMEASTTTITGPLAVSGAVTAGSLTCSGASVSNGASTFVGAATFSGAATVTGVLTAAGGLAVTGGLNVAGAMNMTGAVFSPVPFISAAYKAAIPVIINGVPCLIPCL